MNKETLEEVAENTFGLVDPILGKSDYRMGYESGLIKGVKWMKEQILNQSFFYCQREIEGQSICDKQCEHCKEYYKPLLNQNK